MTQTINPTETITAEVSLAKPRRPSTRVRVLLVTAVAIAATISALLVSDDTTATADARPQVASQLRWEGMAAAARPDAPTAVQLRWEQLAEHVQSESARGQVAESARWEGLAEHHGAR